MCFKESRGTELCYKLLNCVSFQIQQKFKEQKQHKTSVSLMTFQLSVHFMLCLKDVQQFRYCRNSNIGIPSEKTCCTFIVPLFFANHRQWHFKESTTLTHHYMYFLIQPVIKCIVLEVHVTSANHSVAIFHKWDSFSNNSFWMCILWNPTLDTQKSVVNLDTRRTGP